MCTVEQTLPSRTASLDRMFASPNTYFTASIITVLHTPSLCAFCLNASISLTHRIAENAKEQDAHHKVFIESSSNLRTYFYILTRIYVYAHPVRPIEDLLGV